MSLLKRPLCCLLAFASFMPFRPVSGGEENQFDIKRTNLVYVIGTVRHVENRSALIDLGEAHTIVPLETLAVFRAENGHYSALGTMTVTEASSTSSLCRSRVPVRRNDLVITVRELSDLKSGDRHRRDIVARDVVRSEGRTSYSTVNNIVFANSLQAYDEQFPLWEKRRNAVVAGNLKSRSVQENSEAQNRLLSQTNYMREQYRQGNQTIPAAGLAWEQVMKLLAGPTASSGHRLVSESEQEDTESDRQVLAAKDVRAFVIDALFDREPEQQNIVAVIVAAMLASEPRDAQSYPVRALLDSQFPDLAEDDALTEDIQQLVRTLRESR